MDSFEIYQKLKENYLFSVIRGKTEANGKEIAEAVIAGGIKNIEVTFTTPGALEIIKNLTEEYKDHTDIIIGAGTVNDITTARLALLAGAKFIVSPTFQKDVAMLCNQYDSVYLPGCATPQEVVEAIRYGVKVIKAFPGDILTASFISDLKGPFPGIKIMPSGGVNLKNLSTWIEKGAWAVGIGSDLNKGTTEIIEEKARKYVETTDTIRKASYGV